MGKIRVVVFDSNETLLDLSPLDPLFRKAYGNAEVRKKWFKGVLELFLTATVIDDYRSFDLLANSTKKSALAQLKDAGIAEYFDEILSVDSVKRYKPAHEAYAYAAKELGVDLGEVRMVATHAWDIAGAMKAGCRAAWVHRPEKALNPRADEPEITGDDMMAVAAKIIEKDG